MHVRDLAFGGGFTLDRAYNGDDTRVGPFGPGWSFSLGDALTVESDGSVVLRRGSGRVDRFATVAAGGALAAVTATTDTLTKNSDGTYTLRERPSGAVRTFNARGYLASVRYAGGVAVSLEHNSLGQLTAAVYRGRKIQFTFDGPRITSINDPAGRTVTFSYRGDGRLAGHVNAGGRAVAYDYDGEGNLTSVQYGEHATAIAYDGETGYRYVSAVALPDGSSRQYDFPLSPAQIRVRDGAGDATLYVSAASGLLQSVTDANGNRISYSYDAVGRRTRVVNGAGEASTFTYDANGNLTVAADAAGNRWTATYTNGNLTRLVDPNSRPYAFGYDAAGNLTTMANPTGDSFATRSESGQITSITDPLGNRSTYGYDSDDLLTTYTDPVNGKWTYRYDGAARATGRTDPGGGTLAAEYGAVAPAVERDGLNRLAGYTDNSGNRVTYSYDAAGNLSSITLPGDKTVTYQYDRARRLTRVSDWAGNFALYRYDVAGFPVSTTVSGGPVTIYQYDVAHRLRAIVSTGPDGKPVAAYRYTLDAAGNRIAVSALDPSAAAPSASSNDFRFDAANRPVDSSDGRSYRYDARGNLIAIEGSRPAAFTYDAFGRLQSVDDGSPAKYTYDSAGLRSVRTGNAAARRFVYDLAGAQPRVVMEADESNAPVAWYVYGLGLLWKVAADGTTYFYHFDGDGNVVALSNATAGLVNTYRYDAAGRLTASSEQTGNSFRARGESGWVDDGNGLLYGNGAFHFPELRLTLPAAADPSPPVPGLLPKLTGAGACFLEGVAACSFATGRGERR